MATQRIEYIDWLKGLSIICVVWFHTPHPDWLSFSFRLPLFFLLSGIFFKVIPIHRHLARKTDQLVVPFVFFYLLYFIYMVAEYKLSPTHAGTSLSPLETLADLFSPHCLDECLKVNPPLWFILALLNIQLILYALVRVFRGRRTAVMAAALAISAVGIIWLENRYTWFMFGRCLRFIGYYAFGYLYGKQLLAVIERSPRDLLRVAVVCIAAMAAMAYLTFGASSRLSEPATYIFNISLVVALIILFRYVSRVPWLRFFHFYGRNSYVVLGLHYIFISLYYIAMTLLFREVTQMHGFLILLLTLLTLTPAIFLCNRYIPELVGREKLIFRNIS